MRRTLVLGVTLLAVTLMLPKTSAAQAESCTGDCNNDGMVAINEVITCVNIGLELLPLGNCSECDQNGNGMVAINEIITSVNIGLGLLPCGGGMATPTGGVPTPTRTPGGGEAVCGDKDIQAGEECDDGGACVGGANALEPCTSAADCPAGECRTFGGDECAKNCTFETTRVGVFEDTPGSASRTVATVQTGLSPIRVFLSGGQNYVTGKARDEIVRNPSGTIVTRPGDIPVVIPADEVAFKPVSVPGLVCACVRGIAEPELFGNENSGDGIIACGESQLENISYVLSQDHNTSPGSPGNGGGFPNDPDCTATVTLPSGIISESCVEGTGEFCSPPEFPDYIHTGVCNSPRRFEFYGGVVPRGSSLIDNSTSISLLSDAGVCKGDLNSNGVCRFPDYGDDCEPCTNDDAIMDAPENLPTTTGTAGGELLDSNNAAGDRIGDGSRCSGRPCLAQATGSLIDCDALEANPTGGLSGWGIATAFPSIDAAQIGDNVTSTVLNHK